MGISKLWMSKMMLNVGCGNDLEGDARLDVQKTESTNIIASALYLPFLASSFDRIKMSHVLEHIYAWKLALAESIKVLKDSGTIYVEVPKAPRSLFDKMFRTHAYREHVNIKLKELLSELSKSGVQNVSVRNGITFRFHKIVPSRIVKIEGLK